MEKNSIWLKSVDLKSYPPVSKDISVDVCIIGGGITGITTAYYLSKHGVSVAVVEKDKICSKTTGHTTGKVTTQHGLFYKYLSDTNGKEFAKKYLNANIEAMKSIEEIIIKEKISCDFEKKNAFVFTTIPENVKKIKDEVEFTKSLGITASFVDKLDVPIKIHGAIKFEEQAQFNPVKYVQGLINSFNDKVQIYEHSKVTDYKKENGKFKILVETLEGKNIVTASKIVVATRYPIFNFPGIYFIKNYQDLEYAMCIRVKENIENYDIYLSDDIPNISFRNILKDGERLLLVVGNGGKSGEKCDCDGFKFLENKIKEIFNEYEIIDKWVAEDTISLDKIPYIGKYSCFAKDIYVATGFKKWGMTLSNVAAKIISDDILKIENRYAELFNSTRINPIKNKDEMKNMLKDTYNSLIKARFRVKENKKYCSHLGCELKFNETTKEWECPCHGSRYEENGRLIDGPSRKNLK